MAIEPEDRTMKMKKLKSEEKSIPIICPWCNKLYRISKWKVDRDKKIGVSHGMCQACFEKLKNDI